jgi:K+ transporter
MEGVAVEQTMTQPFSFSEFMASDGFVISVAVLFVIIMVMFTRRLNRLEDAIKSVNIRLDNLATSLVDISHRPCQLESHGFNVEITDPTGKKLQEINGRTST